MRTHLGSSVLLGALCIFVVGCGNNAPSKTASDARCPEGQSYDGQFCQVDQNVASAERPIAVPAPTETDEPVSEPNAQGSAEVQPAEEGAQGSVDPQEPAAESPVETVTEADVISEPPAPATPVDYAMAAQAAPVMQYLASSHLKAGARPLGNPFAGQFAEGQGLTKKVQLTAGKCYTIMGIGLPPVSNVDVYLIDPTSNVILLKDDTVGAQAVLGSREKCYMPSEAGSVSVLLVVTKGQGVAAAQVFEK